MGIFDFLFGSSKPSTVEEVNDFVWLSKAARINGLRRELHQRNNANSVAILLVAHFPNMLEALRDLAAELDQDKQVTTLLATDIRGLVGNASALDPTRTIDLIVAERHPLFSENAALKEAAGQLPCRCRLVHHLSLEDVVLRQFAGEWVINTLKTLGMTEEEAIQSPMVARRIVQAQKKLQRLDSGNQPAQSAEQWMELNLPPNR